MCNSDIAVVNDGHNGCSNADNGETGDDTALVKQLVSSAASCAERPLELQNAELQRYTISDTDFLLYLTFCVCFHSSALCNDAVSVKNIQFTMCCSGL